MGRSWIRLKCHAFKMSAGMRILSSSKFLFNVLPQKLSKQATPCLVRSIHTSPVRRAGAESAENWDLLSAVCLERFPRLTKEFTELDQSYVNMLTTQEVENSFLSNHELR